MEINSAIRGKKSKNKPLREEGDPKPQPAETDKTTLKKDYSVQGRDYY